MIYCFFNDAVNSSDCFEYDYLYNKLEIKWKKKVMEDNNVWCIPVCHPVV
jgi:hypothetical protein